MAHTIKTVLMKGFENTSHLSSFLVDLSPSVLRQNQQDVNALILLYANPSIIFVKRCRYQSLGWFRIHGSV
jgi:hypothetical protein